MAVVETYIDSGLTVISMNNSEHGNRLNTESLEQLSQAFDLAITDKDVRVILLRSNGSNFCLGMDLDFLQAAIALPMSS